MIAAPAVPGRRFFWGGRGPIPNFLAGPALQTDPGFLFLAQSPGDDWRAPLAQGQL